ETKKRPRLRWPWGVFFETHELWGPAADEQPPPYAIRYRVAGDRLEILAILHGAQDRSSESL
ncbi:MAG: hypothetical protein WAM01_08365, partial [Candidatus Acidiferrales bacterium]